jgi:hypothetical protein
MSNSSSSGNSSSSRTLMWMTVALFTGFGVMMGGGLFLASRLVRAMGMAAATKSKDTVHTPIGNFRLEKEDQVGPGLPVYPRSSLELPGDDATGAALREAQSGVVTATYHTVDARDFVDRWYAEHLSPAFTRHEAGETPQPDVFHEVRVSENDIAFLAERGEQIRIVSLSADATGTTITLIQTRSHTTDASPPPAPPADLGTPTTP